MLNSFYFMCVLVAIAPFLTHLQFALDMKEETTFFLFYAINVTAIPRLHSNSHSTQLRNSSWLPIIQLQSQR